MCGISLCISKKNHVESIEYVLKSLYQLQNRGYDSFGISYYDKDEKIYKIVKKAQLAKVFEIKTFPAPQITLKILHQYICRHSRWATRYGFRL